VFPRDAAIVTRSKGCPCPYYCKKALDLSSPSHPTREQIWAISESPEISSTAYIAYIRSNYNKMPMPRRIMAHENLVIVAEDRPCMP
jgi:hypothetical protein